MTPATKHNDDSVVQTARTAPRSDRSFLIARWLFVRCLAALYLVTFLSLLWQIPGLLGENGISPAQENLGLARFTLGAERYLAFPTLFWLDSSDAFLYLLCGAGVVGSCLVFLGVAPSLLVPFLWLVHLSFFTVGEDLMEFRGRAVARDRVSRALPRRADCTRTGAESAAVGTGIVVIPTGAFPAGFHRGRGAAALRAASWRNRI